MISLVWSIAQTLFACVEGDELYRDPIPAADGGFLVLVKHEQECRAASMSGGATPPFGPALAAASSAFSLPSPSSAASAFGGPARTPSLGFGAGAGTPPAAPPPSPSPLFSMPLARYLEARSQHRMRHGRRGLSPAFVDLLCRLFRVTPAFRPPTVDTVLMHPWFTGLPSPYCSVVPPVGGGLATGSGGRGGKPPGGAALAAPAHSGSDAGSRSASRAGSSSSAAAAAAVAAGGTVRMDTSA